MPVVYKYIHVSSRLFIAYQSRYRDHLAKCEDLRLDFRSVHNNSFESANIYQI